MFVHVSVRVFGEAKSDFFEEFTSWKVLGWRILKIDIAFDDLKM